MSHRTLEAIHQRFWSKVHLGNEGACWTWMASKDRQGYGFFRVRKKSLRSHRLVYQWSKGAIPQGMLICHACDNPSCVNPIHLFLGTERDNHRDAIAKGRHTRGERTGASKLKERDIPVIRAMLATGHTKSHIARVFGVDDSLIYLIQERKAWAWVAG